MVATSNLQQHDIFGKAPVSKSGVLTINGFGVRVRMQSGHLEIDDGVGPQRRKFRLPRVGHGLKRLVCISEDGFVTLSALKWLSDIGSAFVLLDRCGKVRIVTGPTSPSDARLRRAQSLAHDSGAALKIAIELIREKLVGQERLIRKQFQNDDIADVIARARQSLTQ